MIRYNAVINFLFMLVLLRTLQEDIFKLQKLANTWQMAFNVNKCKLLTITYRKSSVIKYVYNMYQANALSDNSPLLALLV